MKTLQGAIKQKFDSLELFCEKLILKEKGFFAGGTILIYDKTTGWDVQYYNWLELRIGEVLSILGFFKCSHSVTITKQLDAERIGEPQWPISKRIQTLWHQVLPPASEEEYVDLLNKLPDDKAADLLDAWWRDGAPLGVSLPRFPIAKMVRCVEDPAKLRHLIIAYFKDREMTNYPVLDELEKAPWKFWTANHQLQLGLVQGEIPGGDVLLMAKTFVGWYRGEPQYPNGYEIFQSGNFAARYFPNVKAREKLIENLDNAIIDHPIIRRCLLAAVEGPSVESLAKYCGGLSSAELLVALSDDQSKAKLRRAMQLASHEQVEKLEKTLLTLPASLTANFPQSDK